MKTFENGNNFEKPRVVYHGSRNGEIGEFEPRIGSTPHGEDAPPRVYASPNAAFAAAMSFGWDSKEGIDVYRDEDGITVLKIPHNQKHQLNQSVYIYALPGASFSQTTSEQTGETWDSEEYILTDPPEQFSTVTEAVEHYSGRVEIV